MTDHTDIITRLEDAASAALTLANDAGKVAHKPGVHMASIKAAGELGQAIIAVKHDLEQWKATLWAVARELDCLPSTFSDANGHVLKAAIKHMTDARRWRAFERRVHARMTPVRSGWKVVETCQMYGDEKEVRDLAGAVDALIREQP